MFDSFSRSLLIYKKQHNTQVRFIFVWFRIKGFKDLRMTKGEDDKYNKMRKNINTPLYLSR